MKKRRFTRAGLSTGTLTTKQKLLFRMRRYARNAARERLVGRIDRAMYWDDQIEKLFREVNRRGWSEDPFVLANEKSRQEARRHVDRGRYSSGLSQTLGRYGKATRDPGRRKRTSRDTSRRGPSASALYQVRAKGHRGGKRNFPNYADAQRYAQDLLHQGRTRVALIYVRHDRGDSFGFGKRYEAWTIGKSGKFKHAY